MQRYPLHLISEAVLAFALCPVISIMTSLIKKIILNPIKL